MCDSARLYSTREACVALGLDHSHLRAWIHAWESLAGELPRAAEGNRANGPRLIPESTLECLREAKTLADEHDGRLGVLLALRQVLGVEVPKVDEGPRTGEADRESAGIAARVLERLKGLEVSTSRDAVANIVREVFRDELSRWEASQESVEAIHDAVDEAVRPLRAQVEALTTEHRRLLEDLAELRRQDELPEPPEGYEPDGDKRARFPLLRFLPRR